MICEACKRPLLPEHWRVQRPQDPVPVRVCSLSCLVAYLGLKADAAGWTS